MIGCTSGGASGNFDGSVGNVTRMRSDGSPVIGTDGLITAGLPLTRTFLPACFSTSRLSSGLQGASAAGDGWCCGSRMDIDVAPYYAPAEHRFSGSPVL